MKYEISWSEQYDLCRKIEKIVKLSDVISVVANRDDSMSDAISFLSSEISELASDCSRVVSNATRIDKD